MVAANEDDQGWDELREVIRLTRGKRSCAYTLCMVKSPSVDQLHAALRLGVDDFLTMPLNLGELLFRLRAGARVMEHRRRGRQQGQLDSATGLATRGAFLEQLASRMKVARDKGQSMVCIAMNLDYFCRYRNEFGQAFFERALAAVAASLSSVSCDTALLGCGEDDQFFVAMGNLDENEGVDWAQHYVEHLRAASIFVNKVPLQMTASFGVAASGSQGMVDSEELVRRAVEAQQAAKRSGRNAVATYSDVLDETMDWRDLAAPSTLLKDTTARDIMAPCTVLIRDDEPLERARCLLHKSQLPILPVIDRQGRLVGYIRDAELQSAEPNAAIIRDVMRDEIATFEDHAGFGALVNHFMAEPSTPAFIVRALQPMGWVTRASLAALTESLNEQSFSTNQPACHSTSYMLVSDRALSG